MKHLLIILSILLLSSFITSCEKNNHKVETLYKYTIEPTYNFSFAGINLKLGTYFYQFFDDEIIWSQSGGKENQSIYKGQVRKKYLFFGELVPHGFGTLNYYSGGSYIGEFKNGKKHGQGTLSTPNNSFAKLEEKSNNIKKYPILSSLKNEGEWEDGYFHGRGTSIWIDGSKFVGEWKKSKKWNGKIFTKYGKIYSKYMNGVRQ